MLYILVWMLQGRYCRSENKAVNEPLGVIWWNDNCKELVSNGREALKNYLDNSSVDNFEKYLEAVKIAKIGLKEEKKKGFVKFCDSLNPDIPYDIICRNVKRLKKRFLVNEEFSLPDNEIFNNVELNNCFEKISKSYNYNNIDIILQAPINNSTILDRSKSGYRKF